MKNCPTGFTNSCIGKDVRSKHWYSVETPQASAAARVLALLNHRPLAELN